MANSRPDRVAEQIRVELTQLIARDVHDPGIGFITLTRVSVTPDLQMARIYYTTLGDEKAQKDTGRALQRASPFLRRQIAQRVRLRRVPELEFFYDKSIAQYDRVEQILRDIKADADAQPTDPAAGDAAGAAPTDAPDLPEHAGEPGMKPPEK